MKKSYFLLLLWVLMLMIGCSGSGSSGAINSSVITVNSLEDLAAPADGTVTLRSALNAARSDQTIVFNASLDGQTIELSIVGEAHTILKGEVMGMENGVSYLDGYFERDYGKSALYARKNVIIDASSLPSGITLRWSGGDSARVLAVYGDLTLMNVSITGGRSITEALTTTDPDDQPWTLARGGAIAVWGKASLRHCSLYNNYCEGDPDQSRDRGAFGGGLYADIVEMRDCVVSGNSVFGLGAAGGGVYSVGGAEHSQTYSEISNSSICGNRLSAFMTYGGGVYSDGGSIGNRKTLRLINCTIAQNLVEAKLFPGMPSFLLGMGYWRGSGVYMSNGYLYMHSCTLVENETYGVPRTDSLGKSALAGGIAATIGNAHAVEEMIIGHSIITGNTVYETDFSGDVVDEYAHDIFTGSLLYFRSMGYNRIGVIDFSQILVPVGEPDWRSLCRKHYPKQGDMDDVGLGDVVDLASGITVSDSILSMGVDAGNFVPIYYEPSGNAIDQVPPTAYGVEEIFAEYSVAGTDNFLAIFLERIEDEYTLGNSFAEDFTTGFETFLITANAGAPYTNPSGDPILTLADTLWFGPAATWPRESYNYPYIHFWHHLDDALEDADVPGMGQELIGDDDWDAMFLTGPLTENDRIRMRMFYEMTSVALESFDQIGTSRPVNGLGDIGAVELQ